MKTAVFPGTFDPPTLGHLDIVERALHLFDKVYIAIVTTPPQYFTTEERVEMLRAATEHYPGTEVAPFAGLLVDFVKYHNIDVIIRSIRDGDDMDFERKLAQMNRHLIDIETLLLPSAPELSFVSSTLVREIGAGGRRLHGLVPESIEDFICQRLHKT